MKNFKSTLLAGMLLLSINLFAGNEAYIKAMKKGLEAMDNANGREDLQNAANMFDRIGEKESTEWLPSYYSGLCYVYMSFSQGLEPEDRDRYLAKATERADAAGMISENNSEIVLLKGYISMAKLSADPASRGQTLSPLTMQMFGKAMEMDPTNPRAYALMARMELGMARFFGSGEEKACGLAYKSIELFDKEEVASIEPRWGQNIVNQMIEDCNKSKETK